MEDISKHVGRVCAHLKTLASSKTRILIAIAGPPASGKSTLAKQLQMRINEKSMPCGLVPMDGFHFDNETLKARGLLSRKGAPETFDVKGFKTLIHQLTTEKEISVPLFDRARDCVIPDAVCIQEHHRYIIIEGNYLFLDEKLWRDLQTYWSLRVFISPPLKVLEQRLIQRWLAHGLDAAAAKERAASNDIPNAERILEQSNLQAVDIAL